MNVRLLHPSIQNGLHKGNGDYAGGVLTCKCLDRPVKVKVSAAIAHNHACGCTKCWKPEGSAFSVVAVAASDAVTVIENSDKLNVVDPSALIQRHACKDCGTHMYGPVERDHAFKGLSFIHPELFDSSDWPEPRFAAFVSSVIEGGVDPAEMDGIRAKLNGLGLETYDCLSPALMDYLATWAAKKSGILH
ncbi:S-(hydroxymethyl)glutathione synthase [Agrobacterium tumefaciens]|uniref:Glutathione-dependent formaldehyde-activating enzyme n=1 Tax=Agrobacterium tumefaciens TaxID=358 RepID=A0AA44F4Q1_AGRTU|nr:S-(hydroxymethyl)glutathione synthase [Agrobacterium tumefaciens]NSL21224.1 S-(hydroxymethyl)glutathione synthase [Agrobacterium tumefaciens]NTB83796.1 S-(hydroxymethyl)glutathione synthase [Agrobacterium tumefaciens]NTC20735.1 S-(hydroxymethyl)glutathione synthase [Agrobacterium tumefaciens]NTC29267.1 S-(hydroxymethyl)glutathione synthase [Agrobacterium tumefaciens]NTC57763.1 S-(hydroxymethyl)glutathione synthase [Agrobacterium tumefaciens]